MKVYYSSQKSKVFPSKRSVLTTYSNLETRNCIYCKSIYVRGYYRTCHRKSSL